MDWTLIGGFVGGLAVGIGYHILWMSQHCMKVFGSTICGG